LAYESYVVIDLTFNKCYESKVNYQYVKILKLELGFPNQIKGRFYT